MLEGRNVRDNSLEEDLFLEFVIGKVYEDYADDLYEVGYDEEDVRDFYVELKKLSATDIKKVLCIPYAIRQDFFRKKFEEGVSISDLVKNILETSNKYKFTIAFHSSPTEIKGDTIIGKEKDHRDDDKPMAYYSTDYRNMYTRKIQKNVYVVRVVESEESGHKKDNDGKWGRASTLSIISKMGKSELDEFIKKNRGAKSSVPDESAEIV